MSDDSEQVANWKKSSLNLHEGKGWESSAYKEYYTKISEKFHKETADYLIFMQNRHKIVTMDYIATLEHDNKMKDSRIKHLEEKLKK